jgi:hypothetical protein
MFIVNKFNVGVLVKARRDFIDVLNDADIRVDKGDIYVILSDNNLEVVLLSQRLAYRSSWPTINMVKTYFEPV